MKKLIKLSFVLAVSALLATSCNCFKKMGKEIDDVNVTCVPEILTLNNGQVPAEISVEIPAKFFHKKAIIKATPVLVYQGGEVAGDPIILQGEKVDENYKVVNFEEGATINEKVNFKYLPAMRRSQLQVRIEAICDCSDCETWTLIDLNTMQPITMTQMEAIAKDPKSDESLKILRASGRNIAEGINTLQNDFKYYSLMVNMKDNYKRVTTTVETADLAYSISSSQVSTKALKSDEISGFEDLVAKNSSNDRAKQTLFANGYASPDGPEKFNDKLSKARSESGQKAMEKILKEYGLTIDAAAYGEDWDGFKKLVEKSDIKDKNLILQVLSMYDSSTQREDEIKNLATVFSELKSDVLPALRRAQMSNKVDLSGKTDDEMLQLVNAKRYMDLNEEEILHICGKLKVTPATKVILLDFASKKFNSSRAYNNLGVVYAAMGKNMDSKTAFMAAIKSGAKGAAISRNMALINLEMNKLADAKKFAKAADAVTKSAVAAAEGNYAPATKSLKGYNAAIAYTQMGNYVAAKKVLAQDKSADGDYLRAVIASKEGDVKTAGNSLKSAVNKNKNLAQKASSDVNLVNLFESGFKM